MITELVGAAGVGKTQLCLSLAAQCCLPQHYGGLGATAGAVVIDTERKFSAQRLQEVAKNRVPTYYDPDVADHGHENLIRLLENTTVIQVGRCFRAQSEPWTQPLRQCITCERLSEGVRAVFHLSLTMRVRVEYTSTQRWRTTATRT
ncbi:hypothetical protein JKP88DRAFT_178734 [Tribonema minus]|uniref:RecA family profile 1 domain-containing protein n=1 Tax=Tribonema minus TaxID=303371 RepID=A0A835ZA63_9STRA|nr:hypothetical protein JKP88DRAFT_178734 [Tribonema minus]